MENTNAFFINDDTMPNTIGVVGDLNKPLCFCDADFRAVDQKKNFLLPYAFECYLCFTLEKSKEKEN